MVYCRPDRDTCARGRVLVRDEGQERDARAIGLEPDGALPAVEVHGLAASLVIRRRSSVARRRYQLELFVGRRAVPCLSRRAGQRDGLLVAYPGPVMAASAVSPGEVGWHDH